MMRRQAKRALLAAITAGGSALLAVGMLGAGVAQATAGPHVSNPIIKTSSQAGYVATGASFRFISTTFTVPKAYAGSFAEVVLGGPAHVTIPASLGVRAGGGPNSVRWNVLGPLTGSMAGGTLNIAPKVGDRVTESIFFNGKHTVYFTVADLTQHKTVTLGAPAPAHNTYTAAEAACLLPAPVRTPAFDVRLWQFTDSHATTYAGVHGTMEGPWTTSRIIDVASGRTVMSPSLLWNDGQNFGAWLHGYRVK